MISWRRLVVLCGLTLTCSAFPAVAQEAAEIRWRSEYNAARKEAQEKALPLLIDFTTRDCYWCKELDKRTFRDPGIIASLNNKFVPLKIDAERESGLASMLGISSYPTIVLAGPDGKILHTIVGFQDAPKFSASLDRALGQTTPPDWMQKDLALAQKWLAAGDYPRAINALKAIIEDGKGRPVQHQAETLLGDLEKKADAEMARARGLMEKGDQARAVEVIGEAMRAYPGLRATRDAADVLARMAVSSETRLKDRARRAEELLKQARDFYKSKDYIPCLDRCEMLVTGFGDLPEGQEGALLVNDIKSNPEWLQQAADTLSDRLGGVYLALADALLKRGQPDRAAFYLGRVITAFPGSRLAESAQIRLDQLQGAGIRPTTAVEPARP